MSLKILPKKSYCPWNPENVAKVRRDEQREAERLEAEGQRTQQVESEFRMARLKQHGQPHDPESSSCFSSTTTAALPQHINLFAQEENHERNHTAYTSGGVPGATGDSCSKTTGLSNTPRFKPDYLGGQESHNRKNGVHPFYMQSPTAMNKEPNTARLKDDRFKFQLDPMQQFYIQPSVNRSSNNLTVEEATRALLSRSSSTTQNPSPVIPHTKGDAPSSTTVKKTEKRSRHEEKNHRKHHDPSRSKSRRRKRDYDVPKSDEESSQSSLSDHASVSRKHRSYRKKKRSHFSRRRNSKEPSSRSSERRPSSKLSSRKKRKNEERP